MYNCMKTFIMTITSVLARNVATFSLLLLLVRNVSIKSSGSVTLNLIPPFLFPGKRDVVEVRGVRLLGMWQPL